MGLLRAATGEELDEKALLEAADRIYTLERAFLVRKGISRKDDLILGKQGSEPVASGPFQGERIDPERFGRLLDEYYDLRGWDRKTGIREISVGGVGCQWWTPDGHPMAGGKSMVILGPTVYPVEELSDAETWAPGLVRVTSRSNVGGRRPAEAAIADLLPWPAFVVGLTGGVVGMAAALSAFIRERGIDLFVAVDIGSDSFFSGKESAPTHTSMVDFMSLGALLQLPCPTVFGLAGYGCDGEMALEELEQNVGIVMRHGGYLGAHGLTQRDVIEMERACAAYGDPVEIWSPRACWSSTSAPACAP